MTREGDREEEEKAAGAVARQVGKKETAGKQAGRQGRKAYPRNR